MGKVTDVMNARAAECEDMEELDAFFDQYADDMVGFDIVLNHLLEKHQMTKDEFIKRFGKTSDDNIMKWFDGSSTPHARYEYIKIALLFNMSVQEANAFLTRAAGYGKLYPKNIDDAACIHALLHHMNRDQYLWIRDRMRDEIDEIAYRKTQSFFPPDYVSDREALVGDKDYFIKVKKLDKFYKDAEQKMKHSKDRVVTNALNRRNKYLRTILLDKAKKEKTDFIGTDVLMNNLCETTDLIQFVRDNWEEILTSNYKLLDYIERLFDKCELVGKNGKKVNTINALVTYYMDNDVIDDTVGNKLTTFFSRMRTNCATDVDRNYIILLGILLELDVETINTMMDIAHMDHLCSKNHGEATIISALGKGSRDPQEVMDILSISDYSDYLSVKNLLLKFFSKEDLEDYGLI